MVATVGQKMRTTRRAIAKKIVVGYNTAMEKKEIGNISDYFSQGAPAGGLPPEKRWEEIFSGWIDKIDQDKMMLNLFELKLWFESLEEFNSSPYFEDLVFRLQGSATRNYDFYVFCFHQVAGRITALLKELDFKKDKYFLNFEEFIVEKILENGMEKTYPYLKELYTPESWFNSFRIFLQNFRNLISEILREDTVSQRAFLSLKKLYHRELLNNTVLISLLKRQFIPKMDKIYQPDISKIISACKSKELKKALGIFFVLAFRLLKVNNFIELNLNKNKFLEPTVPLVLSLKKNLENILDFNDSVLLKNLESAQLEKKAMTEIKEVFKNLHQEYKKLFEGELPKFFSDDSNKIKQRKIIQSIIMITEVAMRELIESVSRLFNPALSGSSIFENFVSRKQRSIEVRKKLLKLHTKINDYFLHKANIAPSEIFFDINQFIEADLNYLLYKDWNEFLGYYDNLSRANLSSEFEPTLRAFHSFLTRLLKDFVTEKK